MRSSPTYLGRYVFALLIAIMIISVAGCAKTKIETVHTTQYFDYQPPVELYKKEVPLPNPSAEELKSAGNEVERLGIMNVYQVHLLGIIKILNDRLEKLWEERESEINKVKELNNGGKIP